MKFDIAIIGGGLAGHTAAGILAAAGFKCLVISFSESVHHPRAGKGYSVLKGDRVTGGKFVGNRLDSIRTINLGESSIEADYYILATGKFLAGGLTATTAGVRESVFNLDCVSDPDRDKWTSADFFAEQPFLGFGVITDDNHRCFLGGKLISNLLAAGEVLCGKTDIEGSARRAAQTIIETERYEEPF